MQNTTESKGRQLTWADIPDQYYINRFRLERAGRSYAVNYTEDPITDVYRSIYEAYCKDHEHELFFVPDGTEVAETGVFESDLKDAEEECKKRANGFYDQKKWWWSTTTSTSASAPITFNFATVNPK